VASHRRSALALDRTFREEPEPQAEQPRCFARDDLRNLSPTHRQNVVNREEDRVD
jgi:hypothetical protein